MSSETQFIVLIAAVVVAVLLAAWVLVLYRRVGDVETRFDQLFADANGGTIGQMLAEYLTTVRSTSNAVARIKGEHDSVAAVVPNAVQHVGLVRFSPFHDTGGDQSFALALLDGKGDGVVVTALHSRSDSRLYAKPIQRGASEYSLSPEEREAMDRALQRAPLRASVG